MLQGKICAPVFVIGSPRSGTSVLTWCLGQHPDLLATEESNWMGEFAAVAAVAHAVGSVRGERSQLRACGLDQTDFLAHIGAAINKMILGQQCKQLLNADHAAIANPVLSHNQIKLVRDPSKAKCRWVDGTPEYSLQVPALRALFPDARFIHIVRNVNDVVKSMLLLQFHNNKPLVATEQEALAYWLRCVKACLAAEQAYGSAVILRVRYRDLVSMPEREIKRMLNFLSLETEQSVKHCVEPLAVRLNSSRVPPNFDPFDPATDDSRRHEALELSNQLEFAPITSSAFNLQNANEQDQLFLNRVEFLKNLDVEYSRAQANCLRLEQELLERSNWARQLDKECREKDRRILELQKWPSRLKTVAWLKFWRNKPQWLHKIQSPR